MKRKILAIVLALTLMGSVTACGGNSAATDQGGSAVNTPSAEETAAGETQNSQGTAAAEEVSLSGAKVSDYPMLENLDLDGTPQ